MMNQRLTELISRKLSGEATATELQELYAFLQSNPGDQYFSEILSTYWNNRTDQADDQDGLADQHFAHILEMAGEQQSDAVNELVTPRPARVRLIKRISIAAAVAAILMVAMWIFKPSQQRALAAGTSSKMNEVVAGRGIRTKMTLPDGTQVWLNSDSKLQYAEAFTGNKREVTLEGEAYFDVVRDPQRPFIVHTSAIDIRVLGTAFNVKSYPLEKTIEATLIHGLIEVFNKNKPEAPKIILRPKEKLVFNKEEDLAQSTPSPDMRPANGVGNNTNSNNIDVPAIAIMALPKNKVDTTFTETSWVYNRLSFEGDRFEDVAIRMERWYNVKINFNSEKIANYRLTGSFEDENIDQAMQALQFIARFKYRVKNSNEVEITE